MNEKRNFTLSSVFCKSHQNARNAVFETEIAFGFKILPCLRFQAGRTCLRRVNIIFRSVSEDKGL